MSTSEPTESRHDLRDRVVVVTGGGRGLGADTARYLARQQARVAVLDIDEEAASEVMSAIEHTGGSGLSVACDVADAASVSEAAEAVTRHFGRVDGLINNAGVIAFERLEDLALSEWERLIAVNLTGTFLCTQYFGRIMIRQGSGAIVNIASVAAGAPQPNSGAYSVSKAGVAMLARQTAVEWGPLGIRANAVSPGIMETPMAQEFLAFPEARAQRLGFVPSRRFADPEDVAAVMAWLLSSAASYVNGQNIEVDGGMMQVLLGQLPRPGTPELH